MQRTLWSATSVKPPNANRLSLSRCRTWIFKANFLRLLVKMHLARALPTATNRPGSQRHGPRAATPGAGGRCLPHSSGPAVADNIRDRLLSAGALRHGAAPARALSACKAGRVVPETYVKLGN